MLRHHLAHGYTILLRLGRRGQKTERLTLHVIEHHETVKRVCQNLEQHKKDPKRTFFAEDLHPMYAIEELEQYIRKAQKIVDDFQAVTGTIKAKRPS